VLPPIKAYAPVCFAKPTPLLPAPVEFVTVAWDAQEGTDELVAEGVVWWNTRIGYEVLRYIGKSILTDGDLKPPFIGVRTAPEWIKETWEPGWIGQIRYHHKINPKQEISELCIEGSMIYMRDSSRARSTRYRYILHELGHALGLVHSNEESTIMYSVVGAPVIGEDTWRDLFHLYGARL
jgi:hypothetical protein